ncbi:MAG: aldolase/citrate lyase family protein, partial [Candidatus Latescibacteria bacterium]|nr:aldolase/citrate lyase family protein [Candidatus Latescibacterota bacterium]
KGTAVDQLDEILEIEGIDMIQWGPSDYSVSTGKIGQWTAIKPVEKMVIEKSLAAGIQPRAELNSIDDAKYYLDLGVKHFCVGTDVSILHQYWKTQGEGFQKAFEGM